MGQAIVMAKWLFSSKINSLSGNLSVDTRRTFFLKYVSEERD